MQATLDESLYELAGELVRIVAFALLEREFLLFLKPFLWFVGEVLAEIWKGVRTGIF